MELRSIPGFPKYLVSDCGEVFSDCRPWLGRQRLALIHETYDSQDYYTVRLKNAAGKYQKKYVHQLVLLAFVGPCPNGLQTRHLNGNGLDNRRANLLYGTPAANHSDKELHGTDHRGERHPAAKLTEAAVLAIRQRYASGEPRTALAAEYGIHEMTVGKIVRKTRWTHI